MLLQVILAFFALVALEGVVAQQIDSPTVLVQCSPVRLTFSGGAPPYVIDVIPGGDAGAVALESINAVSSPLTWTVDLAAGTNVTLRLRDSTGAIAFSSPVVVQTSSDASCIGRNSLSSSIASTSAELTSTPAAITSTELTTTTPVESTSEISTTSVVASSATSVTLSRLPTSEARSTSVAAPSAESPVTHAASSGSVPSLNSFSLGVLAVGSLFAVVGASA